MDSTSLLSVLGHGKPVSRLFGKLRVLMTRLLGATSSWEKLGVVHNYMYIHVLCMENMCLTVQVVPIEYVGDQVTGLP